ncbi:Protein of unknown function [Actinopolyspora mzabensis]|uniref:Enediyne biosynthesis protein n=1 Tax=Actinopolyspora mzabensis TaxID=995066 RepID=A0A1G8Y4K6_ACTMZ|nr:DUF1702 family protein [Actinopolyspora mzabensis]SDJ97762.1 Protein of unknown function [Actinopolyspora mzabensis]
MSTGLRPAWRRLLTPHISATYLSKRGFHRKNTACQELLEKVGSSFLDGYGKAIESVSDTELRGGLDTHPALFRGFAYEGAAMGLTVLDGLPTTRNHQVAHFLSGIGREHVYTAYVGIGWAMARLPRLLGPSVRELDPLLRWLVLDGYGFHQAYFRTRRYVHRQYRPKRLPWPEDGSGSYPGRAVDQGIGRAMWFVGGADTDLVSDLVYRFPEHRRRDLFSGVGLAATYAGGADEVELRGLTERAAPYFGALAQGAAFAAEARVHGECVVAETELATEALLGMSPTEASSLTRRLRPQGVEVHEPLAYESWRQRIADAFSVPRSVDK